MNIETTEDLIKALEETGYSPPAITEILKWYISKEKPQD